MPQKKHEEGDEIDTESPETKALAAREPREVIITQSFKVKQLKQAIKDSLGIKDKVSVKLYLPEVVKPEEEEVKEGDALADLLESSINDDKAVVRDTGLLENRDKLEVEIVITVTLDVQGKGKDYSATLEVSPDAEIQQTLQSKVSFFKAFVQQRRMNLYIVPPKQQQQEGAEA